MKRYIKSNDALDRLQQRYKYKGYIIQQSYDERFPYRVLNAPDGPGYVDFTNYESAKRYIDSLNTRVFTSSAVKADWASELHNDLKDADTSEWSEMMTDKQMDDIDKAGDYDRYIKKERISSATGYPYTSAQKEYVYRCVAESPEVPDMDASGEEWSVYHRDFKEYKDWAFVDAVEDGIFTEEEYMRFIDLWDKAETDMAAPYA